MTILNSYLYKRGKEGLEVDFAITQVAFFTDILPVNIDGIGRQSQEFCDVLGGQTVFDQAGHLDFARC